MNTLGLKDIRVKDVRDDPGHHGAFMRGWNAAIRGGQYKEDSLNIITWQNMGFRLGQLFGDTPPDLVEELFQWCARQLYAESQMGSDK